MRNTIVIIVVVLAVTLGIYFWWEAGTVPRTLDAPIPKAATNEPATPMLLKRASQPGATSTSSANAVRQAGTVK